jgi:aminoglycoside/choline kinase family phosphotransferase
MDSILEKRNFNNFIKYTEIFNNNRIRTPKIIHKDINNRILIIEDLGDVLFFDIINKDNLKIIYSDSIVNI